jgi:hypothetical protein
LRAVSEVVQASPLPEAVSLPVEELQAVVPREADCAAADARLAEALADAALGRAPQVSAADY